MDNFSPHSFLFMCIVVPSKNEEGEKRNNFTIFMCCIKDREHYESEMEKCERFFWEGFATFAGV